MTSTLCLTCRQRLDAVLWSVGRHPGCRTSGPLDADAFDRLTRYLALRLGAEIITLPPPVVWQDEAVITENPNEEEN
ncbi:MAG: hypothetical protein M3492_09885 [Actinomycetota bacterium]|nr:hypothetical protein [Actinomycetota bacterium]